jgi:hypothetical protein
MRKAIVVAAAVLVFTSAGTSMAAAAEFHSKDLEHGLFATWSSCGAGTAGEPCAFTNFQAFEIFYSLSANNGKQDCVFVFQGRGVSLGDGGFDTTQPFDFTLSETCGVAMVVVAGSLNRGTVRGDIPAQDCHVIPPNQEPTCVPTSLSIALDWQSGGEVVRYPNSVSHQSPVEPEERCLQHYLLRRATPLYVNNATVTGRIDGLPAPLGDLTGAFMQFGGVITIGTVPDCFD